MIKPQARNQRHALVIGNNAYIHLEPLRTAVGDARAVSAVLDRLGFLVTQQENIDYPTFVRVLARFTATINPGDKVLLHFSGHGVAIDARNYLLPTDMVLHERELDTDVSSEVTDLSVEVGRTIDKLRAKAPEYVFAIIDACRKNPFPTTRHRSIGLPRGLASMGVKKHSGVFILYAAEPEHAALDSLGPSDHADTSVFTRVLLRYLEQPGQTLQSIAKETQTGVNDLAKSARLHQVPEYTDRTLGWPTLDQPAFSAASENPKAMVVQVNTDVPAVLPMRPRREESVPGTAAKLSAFFHTVFGSFLYVREANPTGSSPLDILGTERPSGNGRSVDSTHAVAFSPDGGLLACGGADGRIRLWSLQSGRFVRSLEQHGEMVRSVAFSPDGSLVVSGGDDRRVRLWETKTGTLLDTLTDHRGLVRGVAFSPDGRTFAATDLSHSLKLRDTKTKGTLNELVHAACVLSFAYSPDGTLLVSSDEGGAITLWDPETGDRLYDFPDPDPCVTVLAFSPSEDTIACGADDGSVTLRDVESGTMMRHFADEARSFVASVAFSSDGEMLATGRDDGTVDVRKTRTGELMWRTQEAGRFVFSLAFSVDDCILASGTWGNEIRLHDAKAGQIRGRLLTLPEREWAAIGRGGYTASDGAHRYLRLIRKGNEERVDDAFQNRWLRHD